MTKKWIAAAVAVLLVGCAQQPTLPDSGTTPATVVFATDLHYLSQSLTDNGEVFELRMRNGDGKALLYVDQIVDAFVEDMIALSPDAVVLGGDVTLDGELASHKDLATKLERIHKSGIPVLTLPGNHDVNNYMASGFSGEERYTTDTITRKEFSKTYDSMGAGNAVTRDKGSLSYIYPVRSDLWLLLLDVNENDSFGSVTDETYRWLETWLQKAKEQGTAVVGFTHQNALQHNPLFSGGFVIKDNERLVKLFKENNVKLNLSGHIHMQHIAQQDGFAEAVTASLAVTPSRYATVQFDGQQLQYSTKAVDVAGWAERGGATNPDLLDFGEYTHRLFWEIAYAQSVGYLGEWGIDPDHVHAMAEYYADINTGYFEGVPTARTSDDAAMALWQRYESENHRYQYITAMLDSAADNHLELRLAYK